jgi:hypothetical protein
LCETKRKWRRGIADAAYWCAASRAAAAPPSPACARRTHRRREFPTRSGAPDPPAIRRSHRNCHGPGARRAAARTFLRSARGGGRRRRTRVGDQSWSRPRAIGVAQQAVDAFRHEPRLPGPHHPLRNGAAKQRRGRDDLRTLSGRGARLDGAPRMARQQVKVTHWPMPGTVAKFPVFPAPALRRETARRRRILSSRRNRSGGSPDQQASLAADARAVASRLAIATPPGSSAHETQRAPASLRDQKTASRMPSRTAAHSAEASNPERIVPLAQALPRRAGSGSKATRSISHHAERAAGEPRVSPGTGLEPVGHARSAAEPSARAKRDTGRTRPGSYEPQQTWSSAKTANVTRSGLLVREERKLADGRRWYVTSMAMALLASRCAAQGADHRRGRMNFRQLIPPGDRRCAGQPALERASPLQRRAEPGAAV